MGKITIRQPQVKVTVYLNDTSHFARYNSVYAQRFPQPNCDFSFSFAQKRAPPMPSVPRLGPSLDDAHLFDCRSCPHCELVDSPGRALLAGTGSDPGRRSLLLLLAQGAERLSFSSRGCIFASMGSRSVSSAMMSAVLRMPHDW